MAAASRRVAGLQRRRERFLHRRIELFLRLELQAGGCSSEYEDDTNDSN